MIGFLNSESSVARIMSSAPAVSRSKLRNSSASSVLTFAYLI